MSLADKLTSLLSAVAFLGTDSDESNRSNMAQLSQRNDDKLGRFAHNHAFAPFVGNSQHIRSSSRGGSHRLYQRRQLLLQMLPR